MKKHYDPSINPAALGKHYTDHVDAMTREGLHSKADIAAELAHRDMEIEKLQGVAAFFASVIRSGEPWTQECQFQFDRVFRRDSRHG